MVHRKCRDVLCLLFFIAYWAGMFVVCGLAYTQGDINRLVYGVDSYGFSCGSKVAAGNITLDLRSNTKLYFLNPLDLMSITNIPFAKTVCTSTCPATTCGLTAADFPCTNGDAYVCPYYAVAPDGLYGSLPGVDPASTSWFSNLTSMTSRIDSGAAGFISTARSLNLPWLTNHLNTYLPGTGATPVSGRYYQLKSSIPGSGPCYPVYVPTTNLFQRCYPSFTANFTKSLVSVANGISGVVSDSAKDSLTNTYNELSVKFSRYVSDISKGILIIVVAGLLGGLVLSVFWLIILRYLAGFMAWFTIIMVNFFLIGFTVYCFSMAGMLGTNHYANTLQTYISNYTPTVDPTVVSRDDWKYAAIASAIIAGIILIITLLMISRIRVAVACIKVASQAVGAMPSILFYPLLPFILLVGLVVYWVAVSAMLYSAGVLTATCRDPSAKNSFSLAEMGSLSTSSIFPTSVSSNATFSCYSNITGNALQIACGNDANCYLSYSWNNQIRYAFIYHFFGLLWTNQFIVGISCVTIAGAIGQFYWAAGDSASMSNFPVLVSMKNTFIFHLGSIAFGSLIIAIIQFIRWVLEYLDKKTRNIQEANKMAAWAMSCVKCCMWCLEKIVAFINKNAYIMIGLKGTNYCVSAGRAIALLIMNAMRLITVNIIGDVLLTLGKIAVAAGCGLIAFGIADLPYYRDRAQYPETALSSPIFPVALSILIAYVCAEIFFSVYDMAIDTIMLAFCEDCEKHDGNPKWAPPLLMEAMSQKAVVHDHSQANDHDQAPPPPPPKGRGKVKPLAS